MPGGPAMAAPELLAAAVPAGIAAGGCFAVSTVLQQRVAQTAPESHALRPQLLLDVARRPLWWAGVAAGVGSFAFQALALALGPIALVQPLIVTDLLFALPLAARLNHRRLPPRVWSGAALVVGGLILFLVSAEPSSGLATPPASHWLPVFTSVAVIVTLALLSAGSRRGIRRTTMLSVGAGVMFGLQSALIKSVSQLLANRGIGALVAWQPWVMAAVAVSALLLSQSAYQAGSLAVALPVLDVLEPVVAVAIAVTIFHEQVSTSVHTLFLVSVGAAAVITGIVRLDTTRSASRDLPGRPHAPGVPREIDLKVADRLACRK
jgi:drug/metabolite transporter (DMT)-like permease